PHPLFSAFIAAALRYKAAERLPVDVHGDDADEVDVDGGDAVVTTSENATAGGK
ncbi:hypothetical protein G6039_29985, partial [Rhodococcus aetherivorans]|nr:hypothetical protein [Rhodococcus aetherivorans]